MNKGIFYLFLAGIGYALMGIFIRILSTQIPPFSQIFLRYIGASIIALIYLYKSGHTLKLKSTKDLIILLGISIFGYSLSTVAFTFAVLHASLSTTLFLFTNYIVFVPILSFIFNKEQPTKNIILAILVSLLGSFLLYRPDISLFNLGAFLALLSGFLASVYYVGSRYLKNYPAHVITTYSNITGVITLGIFVFLKEPSFYFPSINFNNASILNLSPLIWLVIIIFAADNFFSWLLTNKGFQTVKVSTGSIILLTEPLLGSFLGIILYQETLSITSFLGIAGILGGILIALR